MDRYTDISKWGKDHWSTLAYAETRAVDYEGVLRHVQMRCDESIHPEHAHRPSGEKKYPTRLNGGKEVFVHDDWSCLEDMQREGLLRIEFRTILLTEYGYKLCAALRKHKSDGGIYADFSYKAK